MSDFAGRLSRLSLAERALLFEKLRRRQAAPGEAVPAIPRRAAAGAPPLSFAQQRLWFLHRLAPQDPTYNVPLAALVTGPVEPAALRRALAAVCARHESLRTTFPLVGGVPAQRIAPAMDVPVPLVDLSPFGPVASDRVEAEVDRLCRVLFRVPFDLAAGPLLRAALVRLAPERHVLVLVQHHIVSDGWSIGILIRDLLTLYHSFLEDADRPAPLPPLPIQYADFAVWQREALSGERLEREVAVWRRRLGDLPAPLRLPADRPRPPVKTSAGSAQRFRIAAPELACLNAVARAAAATPFMVLMACLQVLLHRTTGQTDFAVGTAVANRNRPQLEDLIGFFVNTLALRADTGGDPTPRELLARVRTVALEAFQHQDLPFEKLVEELRPERDPSRTPIFQVALSLLNTPQPEVGLGALSIAVLHPEPGLVKFDLDLDFQPADGGLDGALGYSSDLFDAATAMRLTAGYRALLAGLLSALLAGQELRIADLPMLSAEERRQLLEEWNRTAVDAPREGSPAELVAAVAAARPGSPAIVSPGGVGGSVRVLTYGELDSRADRLARRLRRLGVGPEVAVAVLLPRSAELFLAALAVSKAGGAYLPLDPAYPDERIAMALDDAAAPVALTLESLAGRIGGRRTVLALDDAGSCAEDEREPRAAGGDPGVPDMLAYIVYTSGSTGRPKGVGAKRGALMNLLAWHRRALPITADDRGTLVSGPAFDGAVWELWALLTSGAAIHLPAEEVRLSPPRLAAWLARERITVCFLPTPLGEAVLAEPAVATTELRRLYVGGDRLHGIDRGDLPFTVVNLYGPSEATVVTTCEPGVRAGDGRDPAVGWPIDNARVYLLDGLLQPVPLGVAGELWIGGEILARGYLGRPDLTAAVFVPDPFTAVPGARMYRSGDLARRRASGAIDVLGRLDGQVKVRGVRIELGEIESVLRSHPGVAQAVVTARDGDGGRRLVAFLVLRATADLPADLRAHLRRRLPEAMIPAVFVALPALPLLPGGKIDRRALGRMAVLPPAAAPQLAAPRSELEKTLAHLWAEVLGRERVGIDDSFFDLGGHSLLLARLQTMIEERLERPVPLLKLIEHPTVSALAAWLAGEPVTVPAGGGGAGERMARQRQALELQRQRAGRRAAAE